MKSISLEKRINGLPRSAKAVFNDLYRRGHLEASFIESMLDAAALSEQPSLVHWFAISALHHMNKGCVTILDTIQMAKRNGRKINFNWSAARWKEEHDKLSRYETLKALSEKAAIFDVSSFACHLPDAFPGYLILSSRRLGCEGLRQRHCVASYTDRIQSGDLAIATVFYNRKRWTVELLKTGREFAPLRIGQIKTRFNKNASSLDTAGIKALLGISKPVPGAVNTDKNDLPEPDGEYLWKSNLTIILPYLLAQGIRNLSVEFSGCGDSGAFDDLQCDEEIPNIVVSIYKVKRLWNTELNCYEKEFLLDELPLKNAIQDVIEDYVDSTGCDWYNDDGGTGTVELDLDAMVFEASIDQHYLESSNAHSDEFSLDDFIQPQICLVRREDNSQVTKPEAAKVDDITSLPELKDNVLSP